MSRGLFHGRTFDDFLFRPRMGRVGSRAGVRLGSKFSKGVALELPVVSANMDSVTGSAMARTMALEGGIGIVHRALSIEDQAREVERVKRSHGWIVEDPIRLPRTATLREARDTIRRHGVTGLLIEESRGSGILAGILSKRDMPWDPGREGDPVERHMTPFDRLHVGRPGMSPDEAARILYEHRIEKLPVVDAERRIAGLITKSDILLSRERPDSTKDAKGRLRVGAAVGARGDYLDRAEALLSAGADALVVDIAHGHSEVMAEALRALRERFPKAELVAGNVGTAEGALFLRDLGVAAVKVGIGPGRGCRTRLETAAGVPQLEAIYEVRLALGESVPIIADGGMRHDKDIVLALLCGASSVMLGSMLSGTDEAPGRVIEDPATHEKRKVYRGMTSPQAVLATHYEAGEEEELERALETPAEGQELEVPYRGSVRDVLHRLRGHLRSAVSYAGETSLGAARKVLLDDPEAFLVPLSAASIRESYER
ncbi:MAG TPA: IMP dehydrogenase [Candidatus Eisenbacteria bacterium]|nr:IMP dehydrogenase [Candidatus Eisenbacteria bacterium]